MPDQPSSAASIEAALANLIEQLDRGGRVAALEAVGAQVVQTIESAAAASLEPESQARVKRLYSLALSKLSQHRRELDQEIGRVREARNLLSSRSRSTAGPSVAAGGDCDMAG